MKRILMIAYHYPPLRGSSGIQRTLAFSRDLREFGWQPIILSAHPRAYPASGTDQLGDIPSDVPVYRPFALDTSRHLSIRGAYPKAFALPDRWFRRRYRRIRLEVRHRRLRRIRGRGRAPAQ